MREDRCNVRKKRLQQAVMMIPEFTAAVRAGVVLAAAGLVLVSDKSPRISNSGSAVKDLDKEARKTTASYWFGES